MNSQKLYHYTSDESIDSILKTKQIWLSHIADYNKCNNIEMFLEPYYFEVVKKLKKEYPENIFYKQLPDQFKSIYADGEIRELIDIVFEKSKMKEHNYEMDVGYIIPFDIKCYILCLSEDNENSYLRSYYSLGSNRALEIDTNKLINSCENQIIEKVQKLEDQEAKRNPIKLGNVIRKKTRHKDYITLKKDYIEFKNVIYRKEDKINKIEGIIKHYNDNMNVGKIGVEHHKYINLVMYALFLEALFFKEEGFYLEKESRLVIMCPTAILESLAPNQNVIGKKIAIPLEDSIKIIDLSK